MLNIIFCVTIFVFTNCTGQSIKKQQSTEITADSLFEKSRSKDTIQIENPKSGNVPLLKIYSRAISDYITKVSKQHLIFFDTLFLGKRNNGQADDFPDIVLPDTINGYKIKLIDPQLGKKLQEEVKSRVYINLIGWVDVDKAEFIFVTFSNGFEHKFDCYFNYKYNSKHKVFDLTRSRIELFSKN